MGINGILRVGPDVVPVAAEVRRGAGEGPGPRRVRIHGSNSFKIAAKKLSFACI